MFKEAANSHTTIRGKQQNNRNNELQQKRKSETTEAFSSSTATDNPASTTESTTDVMNEKETFSFLYRLELAFYSLSVAVSFAFVHIKCRRAKYEPKCRQVDRGAKISLDVSINRGSNEQNAEVEDLEMAGDVQYQINSLAQLSESCLDGEKIGQKVFNKMTGGKIQKEAVVENTKMSDSESFRSCSSVGSEEERSGDGDSQPGVGIQPFDLRLLDTATNRRRDRREEPGQEGPVVDSTVLLEVPAIPQGTPEETQDEVPRELVVEAVEQSAPVAAKVSVSGEQEVPVLVDGLQTLAISEETLNTPEETEEPEVQGEVPTAHSEEQSASVPASTDPMAFKREIPDAWRGRESQVWTGPISGYKERTWRVSVRDVACPVPGCPVMTRHLREHALGDHVSPMFESNFNREVMSNQGFHQFRGHMVILLARWLTGREDVTSSEFVSWLQERAAIPSGCKIQGVDMPPLRAVCLEMNWQKCSVIPCIPSPARFCQVAEPVVAQSTTSVPVPETTVQASSSSVDVPPVTQTMQSVPQKEEEKRVTPPVEEPVAVTTNPNESLLVLVFHNTRQLVAVTYVASAVAQARELFDLEDQEVVLTYLGAELTRSVRMELLPAMAELTVTVK
ncbi:unnamed protein product [Mytilus edulis]|uniref:Uncharacterized protein n=1 Tax=Mytilus edulis TaxID=6550 RepID=A0A8S3UBU1_MYTED|nr:unnamed protein product [Mytilus edulis]